MDISYAIEVLEYKIAHLKTASKTVNTLKIGEDFKNVTIKENDYKILQLTTAVEVLRTIK